MPTYEYVCTKCGEGLEAVQSFTDDPLRTCPACKGKLRKLFSPVGVVFKGSGFYKTDSRGKSKVSSSANSSSESGASSDSAKSSDSTSTSTSSGSDTSSSTSAGSSSGSGSTSGSSSSSSSDSTGGGSKVA